MAVQIPQNLRDEYAKLYSSAVVSSERKPEAIESSEVIVQNQRRYKAVGMAPWWFIGIIHLMECDLSFRKMLHNGDPLSRNGIPLKTVNDPGGRGPFDSWEEAAKDAILYDFGSRLESGDLFIPDAVTALYLFEVYNGMGYRRRGIHSPYLWSGTQHYTKGKYVADGKYDPEAVSKQIGCATIMLCIERLVALDLTVSVEA